MNSSKNTGTMRKFVVILSGALLACQLVIAQSVQLSPTVIASAGNYAEAGGISLSWTLGEVAVTTLSQGDLVLTQGFHQTYPSNVGFSMDPVQWQIIAYPNPVRDALHLQFDVPDPTDFLVEIQDVSGRLLRQEQHKQVHPGDVVQVGMSTFSEGVYFVRIFTTDRNQVRVFSITRQ
jgi:hypothetical protein